MKRWRLLDPRRHGRNRMALAFCFGLLVSPLYGRTAEVPPSGDRFPTDPARASLAAAVSTSEWAAVEKAVDLGLGWLAARQGGGGDFAGPRAAQPAVTALTLMAFLSRGHRPGEGPFGEPMNRALDYILSTQADSGLFSGAPVGSVHEDKAPTHSAAYNHAIAGIALCEAYGSTDRARAERIKAAVVLALEFTRTLQSRSKAHAVDRGGWRYIHLRWDRSAADSDLSVTGWQLMFLRSAQNAEFQVPVAQINEAVEYVRRCFVPERAVFNYALVGEGDIRSSRGMVGAGILSLALAGQHRSDMALQAGEWLAQRPFQGFGSTIGLRDRFFYSAYYCSQAMAQLGGRYWKEFYPPLVRSLLEAQQADGSWPPEPSGGDAVFGNVLTTALAVLSLTPPYQLLPVYQR
ncbi:MAG: terpene cyclase/mutase family protein [Verrucomicrobiales bacterium]|nr:terpene cyclase/mutase family protein [Verrucomicrobiales bacterium]